MATTMTTPKNQPGEKVTKCLPIQRVNDAIFRCAPYVGCGSYLAFSSNIMNPGMFERTFSPHELSVANSLWFNAHLGVGLYLFNCKHIKMAPRYNRVMHSVFGTMIFNFGSVLLWATTKSLMPENHVVRVLFGLFSGVSMLLMGKEYIAYVDSKCGNPTSQ